MPVMNHIFYYTCVLQLSVYSLSVIAPCPCPGQTQQDAENRNTPGVLPSSCDGVSAEGQIKLRGKGRQKALCTGKPFNRRGLWTHHTEQNAGVPPPSSQRPLAETINHLISHSYRVPERMAGA